MNEVPPGTRLCAYWSQQYRCLYPGTAAELGTPDSLNDKFVPVEFDDGDSGRINIKDIRLIYSNYPVVGESIDYIQYYNGFYLIHCIIRI